MTDFFDDFCEVRVSIRLPNRKVIEIREAISPAEFGELCYLPPPPPEFDTIGLIHWQEKLTKSNEFSKSFGMKLANALRKGFQHRIWEQPHAQT